MSAFSFDAHWLLTSHARKLKAGRVVNAETVIWRKQNMRAMYIPYIELGIFTADLDFTDLGRRLCSMADMGTEMDHTDCPLPDSSLIWKGNEHDPFDFF